MWLFGRKTDKTPSSPSQEAAAGPQLVRRTEITTEREWTSTVVRRATQEPPRMPLIEGVVPEKATSKEEATPAEGVE